MTLALEPWFARTTDRIVFDPDGWTIRSADGSRTAHSEHTIAITEDGPLVLTQRLTRGETSYGRPSHPPGRPTPTTSSTRSISRTSCR